VFEVTSRRSRTNETVELIQTAPLLAGLPENVRHDLARRARPYSFDRDDIIFVAGQHAEYVHFLIHGNIKVVHETDDGQEVILRMIQPGEIFGGAGGWGDSVYPATGITLEPSAVLRVPSSDFIELIGDHPSFALAIISELGRRLRESEARITALQAERVERRIAGILVRLANKNGRRTEQGIEIGLPLSRQDLAELAGTTLSTVSRVLRSWHRDELVIAGRERVVLLKAHELVMIADDAPRSS
jgi:CRP/FNR family transcriptional regulator, nitrogen oxide reductase regulator